MSTAEGVSLSLTHFSKCDHLVVQLIELVEVCHTCEAVQQEFVYLGLCGVNLQRFKGLSCLCFLGVRGRAGRKRGGRGKDGEESERGFAVWGILGEGREVVCDRSPESNRSPESTPVIHEAGVGGKINDAETRSNKTQMKPRQPRPPLRLPGASR